MKKNTVGQNVSRQPFFRSKWQIPVLALIAVLSFGLNFYAISKTGYGNEYYAAAVKSMTQSFKNFFFVSFDPAGMVSVDKPPLGLWIQALFVLAFGYHGWVMLLPQALAGTASCLLLYALTARFFGKPAGLLSALFFALTPAVVVASRNNTMDMQLIFVLLSASWFLFRAIEKAKWRYLFIAGLMIGLGFNIKMLQAYLVLPAIAIVYLIFAKEKFHKRLIAGLISLGIVAAVSLVWVVAVDLYPSGSRPYVDSSTNNTVWELILGHNGIERLTGQGTGGGGQGFGAQNKNSARQNTTSSGSTSGFGGQGFAGQAPGGGQPPSGGQAPQGGQTSDSQYSSSGQGQMNGTPPQMPSQSSGSSSAQTLPEGGSRSGGIPGGMSGAGGKATRQTGQGSNEIGTAGVLRLWSTNLYGQASWLIILAIFSILAVVDKPARKKLTTRQGIFVFWILWLATMWAFFSFAGFYHRYYLCMIAPAAAALSGIGLSRMFHSFRDGRGWKRFLLPVSFLATLVTEILYVWQYTALRTWLVPIMAVFGTAGIILMVYYCLNKKRMVYHTAAACILISILAAPFYWSLTPVLYVPNTTMPYAGPELASQGQPSQNSGGGSGNSVSSSSGLEKYLVAHYKKGSYLVVSQRSDDVAQYIISTGLPAVAYGGFLGSDNALTLTKLKQLVKDGKITYFLVSGQSQSNSELISYVKKTAKLINASEYGESSTNSGGRGGSSSLYYFSSNS